MSVFSDYTRINTSFEAAAKDSFSECCLFSSLHLIFLPNPTTIFFCLTLLLHCCSAVTTAEFPAKVVEVISGDFMVVRDYAVPPVEHRIALSSIRAPKLGRKDEKDEPYAYEAREFLRSRLVGRKVTVGIDYTRPLPTSTSESERVFASVLEGQNNVGVSLVANGLATAMKHRGDDQDRSLYYDDLLQAEAASARDKKGVHSDVTPPTRHINDLSQSSAQVISPNCLVFWSLFLWYQTRQMLFLLHCAGNFLCTNFFLAICLQASKIVQLRILA